MSPHTVNNFVSDLVLMAQAVEKLPRVEAERDEWITRAGEYADRINEQNRDLEQSRTYAASLEQKVHDLEVARDDAVLSFLEADERTSRALDFVKALFGNAGALIQALEPPKAAAPQADSPSTGVSVSQDPTSSVSEQVAIVETLPASPQGIVGDPSPTLDSHPVGERDVPPMSSASENVADHSFSATSSNAESTVVSEQESGSSVGQREPDPTASATDMTSLATASSSTVISSDAAGSGWINEPAAHPGPYHGKRYWDSPVYVSETAWLTGGGTLEDYNWRPQRNILPRS